ncbi:MAG: hypothetical protein M3Y85_05500, partial [Bacteroidota bacterium]|nr:hypothetical protein [Bacteroidota bacterium]
MKTIILSIITLPLFSFIAMAQIKNPGFEINSDSLTTLPKDWKFKNVEGFDASLDKAIRKSGNQSLQINSVNKEPGKFLAFTQSVPVETRNLKRITISVFIKTENVKGTATLWCNVINSSKKQIGYASTQQKTKIDSTQNWKQYTLEFIMDTAVKKLTVGGLLQGNGLAWFD